MPQAPPKIFEGLLYSIPVIEKTQQLNRAELLPKIESGEIDHMGIPACVYLFGPNDNYLTFNESDMPGLAESFIGQPFLRNHEQGDIDARDGTTVESRMEGGRMIQQIRLTTRRGMTDYVEGKIDRFSIAWKQTDVICTVCNSSWYGPCPHWPGREYDTATGKKTCELLSVNPTGVETSAVNRPGVATGTGLLQSLQEFKLSINGSSADDPQGDKSMKFKPLFAADQGGGAGPTVAPPSSAIEAQIEANRLATASFLGEAERIRQMDAQMATSNQLLIAQCEMLLSAGLSSSRLPEPTQARLRRAYSGKVFQPAELQASITEARDELAAVTGSLTVQGPARITGMVSSEDEFRAAIDDLLGAERAPNMVGKKVHRLRGINEAYRLGTGDVDFHGIFDPMNALQFVLGGTATFPGIVKDSLNKMLVSAWARYGKEGYGWWQDIVTIEHFDTLNTPDWVRTGTIGSMPVVAENGDYQELPIGDNVETSAWYKYGGFIELSLEAILRDDIRGFKRMPGELALGTYRNISEQIAAIFTSNSAAGPTMADGGALFNSTAVTSSGGHANLLTTALGTDYTAWKAVSNAMFKQAMLIASATYGTGKRQAVRPKFALVPVDLADAAFDLFRTRQNSLDNKNVENRYYGQVFPLVVPEWTDTTDWAAAADPTILPGIMLGEIFGVQPTIWLAGDEKDPAMFANDAIRIKTRQFLTVGVADWRALHKENV